MARREIFTCDRCGKEFAEKRSLGWFSAQFADDIDAKSASGRKIKENEVCRECGDTLMSAVYAAYEVHVDDPPLTDPTKATPIRPDVSVGGS